MELLRKNSLKQSTTVVFAGYLLSSSLLTYTPVPLGTLQSMPSTSWIGLLAAITLFYLFGLGKYFLTSRCSFQLQIAEYILVPAATFFAIQQIQLFKNTEESDLLAELLAVAFFLFVMACTVVKVVYINQAFPGESSKDILQLGLAVRVFRVVKMCANCLGTLILAPESVLIVLGFSNCIDFLLTAWQVTYVSPDLEEAVMLANFNNVVSLCSFGFIGDIQPQVLVFLPEILLILTAMLINSPIQKVMQFKYSMYLGSLELNRNDFQKQSEKKIIILMLTCINKIYSFDQPDHIAVKEDMREQWSRAFIFKLKKAYMMVLYFYMCEINLQASYYYLKQGPRAAGSGSHNAGIRKHTDQQIEIRIIQKYTQVFGKNSKIHAVLEDKILMLNFIAFCLDSLEKKHESTIPWSYSNQFFLVMTSRFNQNFILKTLEFYQRRLLLDDESLLYKTRNKKYYNYIKHYKLYYQMQESQQEKYMQFELSLKKLKEKIMLLCSEELRLVQKLANPIDNIFQCRDYLVIRQENKEDIVKIIESCFKHKYYLYSDEFTYIFLIFMILFCKSIYKTAMIIQEKFRVPLNNIRITDNIASKLELMAETPLLVCCGLEMPNQKFGQIVMSNQNFRKKFGLCKNDLQNKNKKISDLIPDHSQKNTHYQLMLDSSNFSHNWPKKQHGNFDCFLKINLERERVHGFKQYKINTKIFFSYEESLMYLCEIVEQSPHIYVLESEYLRLPNRISRTGIEEYERITHRQLEKDMLLMRISSGRELELLGLKRDLEDEDKQNSMQVLNPDGCIEEPELTEEEQKYAKIQQAIWSKQANHDYKLLKYLAISGGALVLGFAISFLIISIAKQHSSQSTTYSEELSTLMSSTQGCEIRLMWYLYLLEKVATNKLANNVCAPFIPNLDTYLLSLCDHCINNRINRYMQNYYQKQAKSTPIFDPEFIKAISMKSSVYLTTNIDYSNYILTLSTTASEFLRLNMTTMPLDRKKSLASKVKLYSQVGKESFSFKFIDTVVSHSQTMLIKNRMSFNIVFIGGLAVLFLCVVLFFVMWMKSFQEILQYYELLVCIDENYWYQRVHKIKYIRKQIERLDDYSFKKCKFNTNYNLQIETKTLTETSTLNMTLNQFQNQNEGDIPKAVDEHEHNRMKTRSRLAKIFAGKKEAITFAFFLTSALIALTLALCLVHQEIINNSYRMNKIIQDGSYSKQSLMSLALNNWISYFDDTELRPLNETYNDIEQAFNQLKAQSFFLRFYNDLDRPLLDRTVYLTICQLMKVKNTFSSQNCVEQLQQLSIMRTPEFVSLVVRQSYQLYTNKIRNESIDMGTLCEHTAYINNYLTLGIINSWVILGEIINSGNDEMIGVLEIALFCVGGLGFVIVIVSFWRLYVNFITTIKFEVLTIDTPKDLYQSDKFRPFLNRMYYRYYS